MIEFLKVSRRRQLKLSVVQDSRSDSPASAAAAVFDCLSIGLSNGRVILLETPGKIAYQDQGYDSHRGEFFRPPIGEEEGITYD